MHYPKASNYFNPKHCFHGKVKWAEKIKSRFRYLLIFPCVLLLLNGCATVPSIDEIGKTPFQAFSESSLQLHHGTDQALAKIVTMSTERFMRDIIMETGEVDVDKLIELTITPGEDTLSWRSAVLFMRLEQFQEGARKSTAALVNYAQLLEDLASPELLPQETFDKLAGDLNSNAFDAILAISNQKLTDEVEPGKKEEKIAIFSTTAIEIARNYLESKRRSELTKALKENQSAIEAFAAHMQDGVKIAADASWTEYEDKAQLYRKAIIKSSGSDLLKAINDLVFLNRQHIEQVNDLYLLHQAFGQIPIAHHELAAVLENSKLSLSAIVTLFEAGKRLGNTYEQALASNKAKAAQAIADKATARANMLEAEADNAKLRASAAIVEAVKARAEAEEDSSNESKRSRADELENIAQELQEEADRKRTKAAEAQLAAVAAQNQAIEIKNELLNTGD